MGFAQQRPRRLRGTPALRRLIAQTRLDPAQLVLPLFVREGIAEPVPITSMPGVVKHTRDIAARGCRGGSGSRGGRRDAVRRARDPGRHWAAVPPTRRAC